MTFYEFQNNINEWAEERGILEKATRFTQAKKTQEELVELFEAILHDNRDEAIDAIGDILVTLAIQAAMWNTDISLCANTAWNEIKDRKGKMINGMFVKED